MKKILIVCCLHGNEKYGLDVVKRTPFDSLIANKQALAKNKRFIDCDLNRCFPGNKEGNLEEKLASNILRKIKEYNVIIDIHSTSNDCPLFGIITKPNKEKINLAKKMGLKRLVIMPQSFAQGKSLIDNCKLGISLEVGPHERKRNVKEVLKVLNSLKNNSSRNNSLEIFEIFDIIPKNYETIKIKNFSKIKKGDVLSKGKRKQIANFDFISILVGEKAYENILCFAARKVNLKVLGDYF